MRRLPALLLLVLPACGDPGGATLVTRDAVEAPDEGCVVPEEAPRGPARWKVRPGDTLRRIARRAYGDENLWEAIRDANPGRVGPAGEVRAGDELVLPFEGR